MPLDPSTRAALERLNAIHFVLTRNVTPVQARKRGKALMQLTAPDEPEPVARIENIHIPGPVGAIPLRIYTPPGYGPFPALIYFHGGGGVIGDLESEDRFCRRMTNQVGCLVVSVDYRLAPEYKFPTGPQECYAATCWFAAHAASYGGDASRIAVGGTSAGGNLAAVVAHMARDGGGPALTFQLLRVSWATIARRASFLFFYPPSEKVSHCCLPAA